MIFFLIFGLILGALAVIFALQNIMPIAVDFLFWQIEGSLALILLLAVLMGVVICGLLSIPEVLKNNARFRALQKSLNEHKIRNVEMETKLIHAEEPKTPPTVL